LLEQFGVTIRGIRILIFSLSGTYFTGDGALRDEVGYYRITGRVDDVVIVSGHNLGTAPIEDAINEHPQLPKVLLLVFRMTSKGTLYGYVILKKAEKLETRKTCLKKLTNIYQTT
jgi:acetyl-CoA synthetase